MNLYHITVDLQRYHNERQRWTNYLKDCIQIKNDLFDSWTTSIDQAMMLDYADAVEYQLKLREFYPHAVIKIIQAE